MISDTLLTIEQVADILQMNQAVIRKWIREKKIHGMKVGNKWRIRESDLTSFLVQVDKKADTKKVRKNPYAGCYSYPRWIEFSGLPAHINKICGKHAWHIFRKLIELDCFYCSLAGEGFQISRTELSSVTGLPCNILESTFKKLCLNKYIHWSTINKNSYLINIVVPLITPVSVEKIDITSGGLMNFPADQDPGCRRRFNKSDPLNT